MKENQERAEVERSRNLRYGATSSTELNDFLSDDKEQGSSDNYSVAVRVLPVRRISTPKRALTNSRDPFEN